MTISPDRGTDPALPALTSIAGRPRLMVDGSPFLIRGGELHNSSSGGPETIRAAFEALEGSDFNTILAPVTWETVEPTEGDFDFELVDELLAAARRAGLRLIPLWFGAWKNGASSYAPRWVKTDPVRFPRAELGSGAPGQQASPFGEAIRVADARAFAAFMRHLAIVDAAVHTVIMVQVENEVGLLGDSRDRSYLAEQAFRAEVPALMYEALEDPYCRAGSAWRERGRPRRGSWAAVLGDTPATNEAFMAWAYANHIEAVVAAGKAEHPLPMFTNAWLDGDVEVDGVPLAGGQQPGTYPSGGPLPQVAALWHRFAPSLDFIAPDIYFGSFGDICRRYRAATGALFIPEMRRDQQGVGDVFLAIGTHGALGTSPFGVDSLRGTDGDVLREAYGLLDSIAPLIPENESVGVHLHEACPELEVPFGEYVLMARREAPIGSAGPVERGYGIAIRVAPNEFVVAGHGLHLAFRGVDGQHAELLRVEELTGRAPDFRTVRVLNGDETLSGTAVVLHSGSAAPPTSFPIPRDGRDVRSVRCELHLLPQGSG